MSKVKSSGAVAQHSQQKRHGKRLGVKIFGDQKVKTGQIILKQRGANHHAGKNTKISRDFTIHALISGIVKFRKKHGTSYVDVIDQ